jgi:lactoylglutathione lyase
MHIEHVAIWTSDLERLRTFYESHLGARVGPRYVNTAKEFESYLLRFESGACLEIMHKPALDQPSAPPGKDRAGYAHIAFALGSRERVREMTVRLASAGCPIVDGPRVTGDGYFESAVPDPDGNRIELMA